ncbi:hypothetical protein AB0K60_33150 [Thermopolyspora sp. NPDC052614]|uniref:hypothetical protein n=1 Tax=Thermopolyspora sp. NPDC052614 TaxID=3155682 RepID=UPI0034156250
MLALVAGTIVGTIGTLIHVAGLDPLEHIYDPYAYFALTVLVGRTAVGFGWALLSTTLAALAPVIPALVGAGLAEHDIDALGGDPTTLNILIVVLLGFGLVAYVARSLGLLGDVAAGVICGVLLADVGGRALPGLPDTVPAFRPWPALVVTLLVLGLLAAMRRTPGARLRALAVALVIAACYVLSLALTN